MSYEIHKIRQEHLKLNKHINGRTAVIVSNDLTKSLWVQYWTPEMIESKQSKEPNGSTSFYVENL